MEFTSLALFGGLTGILAACWGKIKGLLSRLTSLFIVNVKLEGSMAQAMRAYCWNTMYRSPFGQQSYASSTEFVRPVKRYQIVGYETIGSDPIIFWKKKIPLLLGSTVAGSTKDGNNSSTDYQESKLQLTFLRGTLKVDKILIDAVDYLNKKMVNQSQGKRFYTRKFFGTGNRRMSSSNGESSHTPPTAVYVNPLSRIRTGDLRLLKWDVDQIGQETIEDNSAIDLLAFPPYISNLVEEVKRWKASENWYRSKKIPWRRAWLLHGQGGSGKTSLVKAIGQDLDMPIFSFDLASMSNEQFVNYWKTMLEHVPCIPLIEDIDNVFKGRENKIGEQGGGLTYDCLLNCISGVEDANGVFLVITTNKLEDLDDALGKPRTDKHVNGTFISTRPGRIDRAIELPLLDEDCRLKIAKRILCDCPEYIEETVKNGNGDSGAQFQERCSQIALEDHWSKNEITSPMIK